jgi:predicted nucleic acid-binding protein
MKRIIIDTNIYSEFKRNNREIVEILQSAEYIGISTTVLGEIYSGFGLGRKQKQNCDELELFLKSPRVHFLSLDEITAETYAIVFKQLKSKGKPIPTNDIWIAAKAIQHGLSLLTLDKHFDNIARLRRY